MGVLLCSLDQPVLSACHHLCTPAHKHISGDIYSLSRHYSEFHVGEAYPTDPPFLISDAQARALLIPAQFNAKVASRERRRAKIRANNNRKLPGLNFYVPVASAPANAYFANNTSLAPQGLNTQNTSQDPNASGGHPEESDLANNSDTGSEHSAQRDTDQNSEDTEMLEVQLAQQQDSAGDVDVMDVGNDDENNPDVHFDFSGDLQCHQTQHEPQNVLTAQPSLLGLPKEIRNEIIRYTLARSDGDLYGLGNTTFQRLDSSILQVNRQLRHQTLDFMGKQLVVVRLNVDHHTLSTIEAVEDCLTKVPFLRVCDELDSDKGLSLSVTSVHMTVRVAGRHDARYNYPWLLNEGIRTSRAFVFEYQALSRCFGSLQSSIDKHLVKKITVMFSNHDLTEQQKPAIASLVGLLDTLHSIENLEFVGALPTFAFPPRGLKVIRTRMQSGPVPLGLKQVHDVQHRLDRAVYLSRKNPTDAYHALQTARSHSVVPYDARHGLPVHLGRNVGTRVVADYVRDCSRLARAKIILSICRHAEGDWVLKRMPAKNVMDKLEFDLRPGPQHTHELRAEYHAVRGVAKLYHEKWSKSINPSRSPDAIRQSLGQAAEDLWLGIALQQPQSDELTSLLTETCKAMGDPSARLSDGFGCYSVRWAGQQHQHKPELLWEELTSVSDETAADRRPVWWGFHKYVVSYGHDIRPLLETFEDNIKDHNFAADMKEFSEIARRAQLKLPYTIADLQVNSAPETPPEEEDMLIESSDRESELHESGVSDEDQVEYVNEDMVIW